MDKPTGRTAPRGLTPAQRFMRFVRVQEVGGCWLWTGGRSHEGYGKFSVWQAEAQRVHTKHAHIWSYEQAFGPVPEGLQLDHFKCDNPSCVNPEHVRPVTARENALRSNNPAALNAAKTHCVHGHEYTPENTKPNSQPGSRSCRQCANKRNREYRRRKAAA